MHKAWSLSPDLCESRCQPVALGNTGPGSATHNSVIDKALVTKCFHKLDLNSAGGKTRNGRHEAIERILNFLSLFICLLINTGVNSHVSVQCCPCVF